MRFLSPGNDAVIYHNFDPRFQSRDQRSYKHNGVLVGPVMQDEAEKVYVCPFDGLFVEEIVGLEIYTLSDIWRKILLLSLRDNVGGLESAFRRCGSEVQACWGAPTAEVVLGGCGSCLGRLKRAFSALCSMGNPHQIGSIL